MLLELEYQKTGDIENIDELLKASGLDRDASSMLALDFYESHGHYDRAFDVALKAAQKNKNNLAVLHAAGRLALRLGKLPEAKLFFEKANLKAPGHIDRLSRMAELYMAMKDPSRALETMEKLMTLDPEKTNQALEFYSQLEGAGYSQQAQELVKAHSSPAQVVRFFNNKGVLLSKSGDKKGAVEKYFLALKAFPGFFENYKIFYNCALALCQLGGNKELQQAKSHLSDSLKLRSDFEKSRRLAEALDKLLKAGTGAGGAAELDAEQL